MFTMHRGRNAASRADGFAVIAPVFAAALFLGLLAAPASQAQNVTFGPPIPLAPGDMAVSGFSGTIPGENADTTVIDPEGFSIKIFDVSNFGGAPQSQILAAPVKGGVKAKDIGQVAPLAFDDAQGGNAGPFLYAGSTSAYGLHIVATDPGPDGKPVRLKKGAPGAKFMDGLFGKDGSPGAIWKIDLTTGKAGLLADTAFSGVQNSGPGLGDIAYDPKSRTLYASDLDTGLIHRFATDYNAANLGQYDHGVAGRTAVGIPPVPDDGKTADILSPAFDTAKPETWGFTQPARRVQALAVNNGRLYYSIAEEPSVWSVGLNPDGSFGGDTRHELSMPSTRVEPITDIVFDSSGAMIVSKRSPQKDAYAFADMIEQGGSQAIRLPLPDTDDGLRGPVDYGVGFGGESKSASGGISLQYGYTPSGHIDTRSCGRTLAVTGDGLREYPADPANPNAIFLLDGVQMSDVDLAGSQNIPPLRSGFLPFDDRQKGTNLRGHVGDVEAFMPCQVVVEAAPEMMPGGDWGGWGGSGPIISNPPIVGGNGFGDLGPNIIEPPIVDGPMGGGGGGLDPGPQGGGGGKTPAGPLLVTKKATVAKCSDKGNDPCTFAITISNDSAQPLTGPITITDTISAGALDMSKAMMIGSQPPAPWTCLPKPPKLECTHPGPIPAGQGATINVIVHSQGTLQGEKALKNCASAKTATGIASQEACASIPTEPQPKLTIDKKFESATCTTGPNAGCGFTIKITNNGFANFKGPLEVNEIWKNDAGQPFTGGKAEVLSPTTAGFTCGDPSSGIFKCNKPDVDLKPGDSVTLRIGASFPKGTQKKFENCAQIMNHSAQCVSVPLVSGPSLQISKKMSSSIQDPVCTPFCEFEILVKNVGNEVFEGPIVIKDFPAGLEAGAVKMNPVAAPWECAGNGNEKQCTHPKMFLHPTANVPPLRFKAAYQTQSKDWQNCATLVGAPADPGNATSCINLTSESKANIKVTKKASTETCEIGGPCKFVVTVQNTGPHGFFGPITIADEITGGVPASVTVTPDAQWKCTSGGAGKITCQMPKAGFSAQGFNQFEVVVVPGATWKKNDILTNCATLQYGPDGKNGNDHGAIKTDDKACASIKLDPFKLEAQKSGDQQCQPGSECKFKLTIFNPGPIDHHAPVIVTDSMTGVGSAQIVSINPPLGCPQQPTSVPFTCTIPHMDLVVDQRVDHEVVLKIPDAAAGGSFSNCLDIKGQASGGTGASKACVAVALAPKDKPQEQQQQQTPPPPPPATNALPALRCAADEVGVYPNCYKPNNPGSGGSNMVAPNEPPPVVAPPPIASAPPAKKVAPCKGGKVGTPPNCRCPSGTVERKGVCQKPQVRCPSGTSGKYPNCVRDCPPGTIYEDGVCLRDSGDGGPYTNRPQYQECPPGTSGNYPNCVRDCPTGYVYRNGVCMTRGEARPQQEQQQQERQPCPPGTYGRYPRCRAEGGNQGGGGSNGVQQQESPKCPPGTIGVYPRCGRPTNPTGPIPQMPPDQVGPSPKPVPPPAPAPRVCPPGLTGPNCDYPLVR